MDKEPENIFQALTIPRKEVPGLMLQRYKVYKDRKSFVLVEADSAQDALQTSGVQAAYRIERAGIYLNNVIDFQTFSKKAAEKTMIESAPPEAVAPQAASLPEPVNPAISVPEPETPLSNDDIDKLLKS